MGMALNRAAFMRKDRRLVASFIPFILAVSSLSAISVITAAPAKALTNADCTPTVSGLTATAVASGNDCIITITAGTGTWTIPNGITSVSIVVVGGGGGGGGDGGSGGGGGEVRTNTSQSVTPGSTANISIGSGGNGGTWGGTTVGATGSATTITGVISYTANGGVGGGGWLSTTGGAGGSGGSGGTGSNGGAGGGGPGNCVGSPTTARIVGSLYFGAAGSNGPSTSVINSSGTNYGGGGAGGLGANTNNATVSPVENGRGSNGGAGGGGRGSNYRFESGDSTTTRDGASVGQNGTANTGGGGGGGSACDARGPMNLGYDGVSQRTAGGNGGSGVVVVKFTVPTIATPSTPDLDAASDSGVSSTDNTTNDTTPTFSGTATPGSTIQLQRDGVDTGSTCLTNSSGNWQCTTGTLGHSGGGNNYRAVSTFFGQTATSGTLNVIIRTSGPGSMSVSRNDGASTALSSGQTLAIRFGAGTNVTGFALEDVTVTGGTLSNFTTISGRDYSATFTPTANASGTASISVGANTFFDLAGYSNTAGTALTISYNTFSSCSPSSTSSGGFTILTFSSVATCNWSVPSGVTSADVLVVGGGGGGAGTYSTGAAGSGGAGGGGGAYLANGVPLTPSQTLQITIGGGGNGGITTSSRPGSEGSQGGDSAFGTLTAGGGGGGGCATTSSNNVVCTNSSMAGRAGTAGGSGGGGTPPWNAYNWGAAGTGSSVTIGGTTFAGQTGYIGAIYNGGSGSGGGARAAATTTSVGAGLSTNIAGGSSVEYGRGGTGTNQSPSSFNAVTSGYGTGGDGAVVASSPGAAGAAGAQGVVIVKYINAPSITLSTSTINTNLGSAVSSYAITNSGGAASSYSISPAFSLAGLSWSSSTGLISGTPTEVKSAVTYTITATNTSGTSTATFTLTSNYTACSPTDISNGGYTILRFTTVGICNWSIPSGVTNADILVVGGGGAGGTRAGGGGGAGGYLYFQNQAVTANQSINVTVGAGGLGVLTDSANNGSDSIFGALTVAKGGGGGGGAITTGDTARSGKAGGSGGGAAGNYGGNGSAAIGLGTSGQGFNGGLSSVLVAWPGGGGGGSSSLGTAPTSNTAPAGKGGGGTLNSITGTSVCYATGGGAGTLTGYTAGAGGDCGGAASPNGGSGTAGSTTPSTPTANTGAGGGGSGWSSGGDLVGGNGASGVVIFRYANTYTITYDVNGATGNAQRSSANVTSDSYTTGATSVTLPGVGTLSKSGFTFSGWNTAANGTGTNYSAASSYTTTSNLTLYAKWSSVNANLSALVISQGTLSPTFSSSSTNYTATVANAITSMTVTPTRSDTGATITVNGTSVTSGSASGSIALSAGSNTITVVVTAADGSTSKSYTITVTRLASAVTPTISGQPISVGKTAGQSVTFSVTATASDSGTLSYQWKKGGTDISGATSSSYTINSTATSDAGNYTVVVTNSINSTTASATSNAAVLTMSSAVTITTPSAGLSGNLNTAYSLTVSAAGGSGTKTFAATGSLPAGVTISSGGVISGTPTTAGDFDLTVTATDANNATATTSSFRISIAKGVSSISLSVGTYTYTGIGLGPDSATTSGSTGSVTYAYAGRGSTTYSSSSSKPTAVGTYTVTATLAADSNYASVSATSNFDIGKASQSSLTVTSTTGNFGTSLTLTSSGGTTSGSVTYATSTAGCTITSGVLTTTGAVTCVVTATMAGNDNYNSVSSSATSVVMGKATQSTLTLNIGTTTNYGCNTGLPCSVFNANTNTVAYNVPSTAAGSSTGSATFTIRNGTASGCALADNSTATKVTSWGPKSFVQLSSGNWKFWPYIEATTTGTCLVKVTRASDANYEAVDSNEVAVTFVQFNTTAATTTASPSSPELGQSITLTGSSTANLSGPGTFVFKDSSNNTLCTASTLTWANSATTGSCSWTPSSAATYAIRAHFSGDTYWASVAGSALSLTVGKTSQTITFTAPTTKTYGDSAFSISATASSSLTVTFASTTTSVCTVSGTTVTIVAAGTCTLTADQAGNTTYAAAAQESRSFTINAIAALTPTFGTPTSTADGFTVQISNYSSSYQWAGTASASGSVGISNTGLVTVTGIAGATSSTATITTTRTNYATGSATVSATSLALYTISYAGGSGATGSAPSSPSNVYSNASFTTPANTFSRTGYTFAGWSDGTNTFSAGVTYPSSGTVSRNVTLTATWNEITAASAFYAEDYTAGSGTWTDRITSPSTGTTSTGGMSKSTSPTSVVFAGKESSNSDNLTGTIGTTSGLTAVTVEMWVKLADNGSTQNAAGSMLFSWKASTGSYNYNIYHRASSIGFNAFNSELYGISSASYEQKWTHFVFVMSNTGDVTTQKIYINGALQPTLTYQVGSAMGTRAFSSDGSFLVMDNSIGANSWNAKGNLGLIRVYRGELNSTQTAALYNGTKSTYEQVVVTYNSQSGSSVDAGTAPIGGSISSAPTAPTRSGYTLSGWSTTSSGSVITFPYTHSQTTDFTLYAIWAPNTLTVTYDSQSGSVVSNGSVATNATLSAPTSPTRAGYTFSGWSTTSTGSVISFTGGYTHGQTANFTLYAIWSANALTITYDAKGGTSVASGTVNTGASISSAPTAPTRTGYTFSAWSATDGGTAITFPYAHGQTANFTLYALWTANSLTVTYNSKGGTSVTSGTVNTGASISSAPTAPTKTGYTLDGWSLTDGGTVVIFPFAHGQTANFTLYAKWTGTTNTITYDSKGGSSVANGSFVTGGSISAAPTSPTRAGYTLSGWSEMDGGSVITYPFSPTATSGITLYAIWSGVSCSPTSTTTGGYTIYTFTTAGTCFWTVPNGVTDVEILTVAGGGGGGYSWDNTGAGGGAGGQVKTGILTLSTTAEVTVGAGGTGGTASSRRGGSGGNSSISTISALGGTGGCGSRSACATASQATSSAAANGGAGGSGGASGKGGGGSNTTAATPTTVVAGAGTASTYSGSSVTYGAGGAGGTARGNTTNIVGTDGSANTGNGGGGASAKSSSGDVNGGAGGTGLVIVRIASTLTVSFDSQSGSSVSDTSTVTAGVLSEPTAPTRSNYTFIGWFTATSGGSAITFPYTHGQTANFTLYARWSLNSYAIAFNANNGSGTMANQSVTHGVAANLSANLFTRANYVFYRWATNANGTGTTYDNLAQVTLTAGTTLYAQWTANTYVVTYSYNNATGGNSTTTSSFTTGGSVIVLPTPTRTGYTFGGWYSDSGLSNQIGLAGADYSPTGTTLSLNAYAKWTAIDYTFTYNGNSSDGGSVPTETSKQIGQTATVKANTGSLTRAGYTFAGWNTQSNGSGDNYLSGSSFTVQSSNVTLYAKWSANSYTITFNSNGGTGSAQRSSSNVSSDTYTTGGSSVALPGVGTLERTGYTFGGWNTSAAGTGTNRSATDTYTTVSDVIFYAKWNPVTYSITYDGNTSTGGTTPTTGGYTTGQASPYSVATNTFTKTLHVFGGWNTAANGTGTNYSSGSPVTTLSNITLYAIWIPQYTLHYAINGGSVSSGSLPSDQLYNANTSVGPVFSSVSRTGYTFGGWRNGSSTIAAAGSFTIVEDSVLTAIWTPIDYTISYDSDGGTTPPNSFTKQIGQSFEVGSAVSKPGYNFTGWKAGSTTVGAGATVVTGSSNISYTAQWTAKVYRISYDWNGGRGTAVSDVDYTFGTTAITLPVVGDRVKDGYNFAGWAESTDGSALGLTYTPSQTRTLYALWTLGNFTVTYDAGRGTVANSTVAVQNGSSTVLPLPTRSNFVFNGWHTAVTGGSSVGSNGASFTPAASQTVYARWIQTSIYGITDSLSRIGSVITTSNVSNTFSGANSNSSVSVSIPANALPAGTTINFDLVGNSSRAVGVLPNVTYLVSIALSWLTGDETVPDTASDKPISVTISNATIKAGAAAYAIVNNVSTLLGTATQDGTITISITSDPEIVVAATKPGAPTNVSATSNGSQQSVISWSAPSSNGGAEITGYTVTSNTGATCTTSGTSCTISSLTNGTAYTFTVAATNSVGTGVASSSASATTASLYSVTFDAKGGSAVSNGSFLTASTASEPTAPTRSGYSFAGWSASDGGSVEVFPYAPGVTSNITMYAKWDALDNAVTFDAKGGSSVTASVFASGGTVAEPTAPTRSGYTFAGWSATDGGSAITFPYAPGVVTDITLYARWTAASSGGGGGGSSSSSSGSSNSSSNSSNSGGVSTSTNSNVTIVAPVTVVGDKDAKVTSVDIKPVSTEAGSKPPAVKVDSVSDKFIAEVKIVDGKLVLTPETGFSGKKTVTVTITENGVDRIVQIPLTVLPEAVEKPVLTPTASNKSIIRWTESPNATAYTVLLNGKKVCSTSASSCSVKQVLGPDAVIEVISNGGDRTVSEKIEADFRQNNPVAITRLVSATITKATLTKVDTKALDKVIALIRTQGFATVVISEITTTKKTATLAAARIAAIKKYIDEKTGSREITFEVVPAASRTYFNNISVKG